MAEIYKKVPGKGGGQIEKVIALNDGVQDFLDEFILHAQMAAESELAEHHFEGHAFIESEAGDVDRYLILNDERGQEAAMSIEFGREPYYVGEDGSGSAAADGAGRMRKVGGMDGLFILHKAMHLKRKGG